MNTVTISKKEYERLKDAERRYTALRASKSAPMGNTKLDTSAFGAWKNRFGKGSSVAYINRLRKAWR